MGISVGFSVGISVGNTEGTAVVGVKVGAGIISSRIVTAESTFALVTDEAPKATASAFNRLVKLPLSTFSLVSALNCENSAVPLSLNAG